MTPNIINVVKLMGISFKVISQKKELLEIISNNIRPKGIILSGGPLCLSKGCNYDDISKNIIAITTFVNIPILGICFGFQVMCDLYGGKVSRLNVCNSGFREIGLQDNHLSLLKGLSKNINLYFSHYDYVEKAPPYFSSYINNKNQIMAVENIHRKRFGFQFHPEGTEDGREIIKNFLKIYCLDS
jgi:GMP synthase (glutamine-hydrolysing)